MLMVHLIVINITGITTTAIRKCAQSRITPLLLFGRETAFWINSAFNSTRNGKEPMIMLMVMVAHISKSTHVPFMVVESGVCLCVCLASNSFQQATASLGAKAFFNCRYRRLWPGYHQIRFGICVKPQII